MAKKENNKKTWMDFKEKIKKHSSNLVEKELEDYDKVSMDDRVISVLVIIILPLVAFYYLAHSTLSTGFFTASFDTVEKVFLYGTLIYWIFTCVVLLLEYKDLSRDVDSYGGLIFGAIGCIWLFIVFPFDFTYFADALPGGMKFLVQWISNGTARVFFLLKFIFYLFNAIIALLQRIPVRKELAKRRK